MAVQSIERAFTLLRTVAQHPTGIGITELARHTCLHKSTVSRLVLALEAEDAIQRLPNGNEVIIGPSLTDLAATATPTTFSENLIAIARPHLERLAQTLDESAILAIPDGNFINYIDQVQSHHTLRVQDWTGQRYPLHVTSAGKLFLAYASPKFVEKYLKYPLMSYTERTISQRDNLRHHLAKIRQAGYDWAYEEFEEGLVAIAVPIFDRDRSMIAAVNVSGPIFRFPPEDGKEWVARILVDTCKQIQNEIQDYYDNYGCTDTDEGSKTQARKRMA